MEKIRKELFRLQDTTYRDFQSKLIPTIKPETVIGVRTPELRRLAKEMMKQNREETDIFLEELPHAYFDENQLHAFLISEMKDFELCMDRICRFLPFVDNWATCDQMSPKIFKKEKRKLLPYLTEWISSGETYTVRFAVGMLMQHFLDEDFKSEYPRMVADIHSDDYYVNMMIAWYFATALAKQYENIIPYFEQKKLDPWTHKKAIQKAAESYRITSEQKVYLKGLK